MFSSKIVSKGASKLNTFDDYIMWIENTFAELKYISKSISYSDQQINIVSIKKFANMNQVLLFTLAFVLSQQRYPALNIAERIIL